MNRTALATAFVFALSGAQAGAGQGGKTEPETRQGLTVRSTFLKEIIATSDALDGPTPFDDTILHLRGAIEAEQVLETGTLGLTAGAEAFQFEEITFESDRTAHIGLTYAHALSEGVALRASLGYAYDDQGDDLDLGAFIIGTRTRSHIVSGRLEGALRLSDTTVLNAAIGNAYEHVGKSSFSIALLDLRLTPHLNATDGEIALSRTIDKRTLALIARARIVTLHGPVPAGSAIASESLTLAARVQSTEFAGLTFSAEAGLAYLRDGEGITDRAYPVYKLSAARSFDSGRSATLSLRGFLDMDDSDDPLGSHVHRAEFEITQKLPRRFTASAGLFGEWRQNLAIGNDEEAAGIYLALAYDPVENVSFLLRLDYDERYRSLVETTQKTFSGTFGVQFKL